MEYKAKILLLMLRCEYISNDLYKSPLTKKGRGWLTAKQWRVYEKIKSRLSKKHRMAVRECLMYFYEKNKVHQN